MAGSQGGVHNEMPGRAAIVVQARDVHGDVVLPGSPEPEPPAPSARAVGRSLGAIFVVVALIVIGSWLFGEDDDFPDGTDPWPKGSTWAKVRASVLATLESCAHAPVAEPANCPQALDAFHTPSTTVAWRLRGDPVDGIKIVYRDQRFHVLGYAIMTAVYQDYSSVDRASLQVMRYRAALTWQSGKATVTDIWLFDGDGPAIVKQDLTFGWDKIAPAVKKLFTQCVSATASPMPAVCPSTYQTPRLDHATWRLEVDPVLNARHHYDQTTGRITVVGSYAATVVGQSYDWAKPTRFTQAGNYEATLVVEGGQPIALRIEPK